MIPAPSIQPSLPVTWITALATVGVLIAVIAAMRGRALHPQWLQLPVVGLRVMVIGLLAVLLLNPSENVVMPTKASRSVLLVDDSASMTMAGSDQGSRWDEANAWAQEVKTAMKAAGLAEPEMRRFAAESSLWDESKTTTATGQATRLAAALESIASGSGARHLDHVVVVSDGCTQDQQRLSTALAGLRGAGITVSTKVVGRAVPVRNASLVSVLPPRIVRANARVLVPVEMRGTGLSTKDVFELVLRDDEGTEVARQSVNFSAPDVAGASLAAAKLAFTSPPRSTRYTLELSGGKEVSLEDNRFTFTLEVVTTKLRFLIAEGTHAKRALGSAGHFINDIEMITAACAGTGEIECFTFTPVSQYVDKPNLFAVSFANGEMVIDASRPFPTTREEINSFDVIMISDVPVGNFSEQQMQWVVDWVVERGGGFIMAGGNTTFDRGNYDKTSWEKITPVDMVEHGGGQYGDRVTPFIADSVRSHPIWQFSSDPKENSRIIDLMPPYGGMNMVRRAKPGAVLLAVFGNESLPVIVVQNYGRGRAMAYMSDPNGGWGNSVIRWSEDGAPALGDRIELGHGNALTAHPAEAKPPATPPPPYPSPYYGAFWINTVKWLGANSVRWRRDKLSGKIIAAQARPGMPLPVTAEYLAETDPAKIAAQEIGARLDVPGSPRVRLSYNRDRREFTGVLKVPADLSDPEVQVIFDASAGRESLTDSARCGVLIENSEFTRSAPDTALMKELAHIGGGEVLTNVASAVAACRTASAAHAALETRTWSQPLWSHWPWWAVVMGLLSLEWLLRRVGRASVALAVTCMVMTSVQAQDTGLTKFIEQLANPKVRLRDKAQKELLRHPEAEAQMRAALETMQSEEAQVRLKRILKRLHDQRWQMEWQQPQPRPFLDRGVLRGTPDGAWIAHIYGGGAEVFDARTYTTHRIQGKPTTNMVMRVLAFSDDGKYLTFANKAGGVWEENELGQRLRLLPLEKRGTNEVVVPVAADYIPGTRRLVILSSLGLALHEPGVVLPRRITLKQAFPGITVNIIPAVLAISGDGTTASIGVEIAGQGAEMMATVDLQTMKSKWTSTVGATPRGIALNRDGTEALVALPERGLERCTAKSPEAVSVSRTIGDLTSVAYAPDYQTAFITSSRPNTPIRQLALPSGDELWTSPPMLDGCYNVTVLGKDRIAAKLSDNTIVVWKRRTSESEN